MRSYKEWRSKPIGSDQLQDELILIQHHIGDIKKLLKEKKIDYVLEALGDIEESVVRMSHMLSKDQTKEIKRITSESD